MITYVQIIPELSLMQFFFRIRISLRKLDADHFHSNKERMRFFLTGFMEPY